MALGEERLELVETHTKKGWQTSTYQRNAFRSFGNPDDSRTENMAARLYTPPWMSSCGFPPRIHQHLSEKKEREQCGNLEPLFCDLNELY